jgi:outer membrane protein OmpA-like peptidoglycan-associated protein
MIQLPLFNPEQKKQFEEGVILVSGKAMNRTALGIVDAFLTLYPKATFADLKDAMPDSINPSGPVNVRHLFKPYTEQDMGVIHDLDKMKAEFKKAGIEENFSGVFFTEPDEIFTTADGVKVGVIKMWESEDKVSGENDLERLIKAVKQYGIVVNKFEPRQPFKKGKYSLEILKPEIAALIANPSKPKKKKPVWLFLLPLILLPVLGLFLWKSRQKEETQVSPSVEQQSTQKIAIAYKGNTFHAVTKKPIQATIKYHDLETNKAIDSIVSNEQGHFEITLEPGKNYGIFATSKGFATVSDNVDAKNLTENKEILKDLYLNPVEVGQTIRLNNLFFDYNQATLKDESTTELNYLLKLLNENTALKIEIAGHTDSIGTVAYNKDLSKRRAENVKAYLVQKGIGEQRLTAKGYGSEKPTNTNKTEEGRRDNRRVEFIILK